MENLAKLIRSGMTLKEATEYLNGPASELVKDDFDDWLDDEYDDLDADLNAAEEGASDASD